jgi:shikimate kinase
MGNIYLVGFMGTGKSVVGKELAKKKKWRFVDLDELIEIRQRKSVSDIFAKDGEPYFRRIEKQALKEVAKENNFVAACGGGIVIDKDNIRTMKDAGTIICLTASPGIILKRTAGYSHRPLLNVGNPQERIELLLKLRAPFYAQADFTIDTSGLSVEGVLEAILKVTGPCVASQRLQVKEKRKKKINKRIKKD